MDNIPLTIEITALKDQFASEINEAKRDLRSLKDEASGLGSRIDEEMNKAGVTMSNFSQSAKDIGFEIGRSFDGANEAIARVTEQIKQKEQLVADILARIDEINNNPHVGADKDIEDLKSLKEAALNGISELEKYREKLLDVADSYGKLNEKYDESVAKHDTLAERLRMVRDEMDELIRAGLDEGKSLDEVLSGDKYKGLAEKAKELKSALSAVTNGKGGGSDLGDSVKDVNKLARALSQMSAVFRNTGSPLAAFRAGMSAIRGATTLTTVSFKGLAVAAKSLFRVLIANPIGIVVAAIAALVLVIKDAISSIQTLAQRQAALNDKLQRHLELLYARQELEKKHTDDAIKEKERELAILEAGNASLEEKRKLEDEIYQMKKEAAEKALKDNADEIDSLEENEKQLMKLKKALASVQNVKEGSSGNSEYDDDGTGARKVGTLRNTFGSFAYANTFKQKRVIARVDGETVSRGKYEDVEKDLQTQIENLEKMTQHAREIKNNYADVTAEGAKMTEQRKKQDLEIKHNEQQTIYETERLRNELISSSYAKEIATVKQASKERIAELRRRLAEEDKLLTDAQKEELNKQIELEKQKEQQELARIAREEREQQRAVKRQIEDAGVSSAPRTAEQQRSDLLREFNRRIEDVESQKYGASSKRVDLLSQLQKQYEQQYASELDILSQKLKVDAINTQEEAIDLRLAAVKEGSEEEYRLRKEQIEKQREAEIENNKTLAEDKRQDEKAINAKYDKQQRDLEQKRRADRLAFERDTINLRLAAVREGSAEELRLRLQLIEKERQAELDANKELAPEQQQSEADINAKYSRQRYALMVQDYVSYEQQMTDITQTYEMRRAAIENQIANEQDPKKKKALQEALANLKKTYSTTFREIQQDFIKNQLGDVFVEATYENVKEAITKLDEMADWSEQDIIDKLGLDGTDPEINSKVEAFREILQKTRREIQDMGKGGYTLKEAFKDAFSGKTREDMERGVDYLVNGLSKANNIVSGLASAMRDFADATNNADLEELSDTFSHIADTISTAGGYAAAGAQIGGGWGAVIGAVLGVGQGVITYLFDTETEKEERRLAKIQEATDHLSEVVSGINSMVSAMDSLSDTITSLNYGDYRKSLFDAITNLKSADLGHDNEAWQNYYHAGDPSSQFRNLDSYHILEVFRTGANDGNFEHYLNKVLTQFQMGDAVDFDDLRIALLYQRLANGETLSPEEIEAILTWMKKKGVSANAISTAYANQTGWNNTVLDNRRKDLIKEMNELYREGSYDSMKYFNLQQKADQLSLDILREQRTELMGAGEDTTEVDNKIAELLYNIGERFKEMFEGLAGIDMQSLANKWLDIFKEFGDNMTTVFEKIDESIDDMIENIIYQTVFVQPLIKKLTNYLKSFQENLAAEQGIDTSQEGWQSLLNYENVDWTAVAEGMRDIGHGIGDMWAGVRQQLQEAGISSSRDRSGSSRGIASASQDSIDEVNGRLTAIQGHTFNISANSSIIRENVAAINTNVRAIRDNTEHLVRIDNDIHSLYRAFSDMQSSGLKIK